MSDRLKCMDIIIPRGPLGFEFSIKSSGSQIVISQVRGGGAAELAGLKVGYVVKAVNQQSVKDMSFLQVSNLLRRSSSLTTELTVCISEEIPLPPPAVNGSVVFRHTSAAKNLTSVNECSSDCKSARPSSQRVLSRVVMDQRRQQQQLQEYQHEKEEETTALVSPLSADILTSTPALHDDKGSGKNHCGLRRQAVLFSKDTVYMTEIPNFSPPISSISHDKAIPESNIDNMISSFSTTLDVSDNGTRDDGEAEPTPPLIRRQAYPSPLSSPLAAASSGTSSLIRDRSVKTGVEMESCPRFLPAHTSPILPREASPQPTFLPRLSLRRKTTSPPLPSKRSPPSEPKFTNLAAYMDCLVVSPSNGSTSGSDEHRLSTSNTSLIPPRLVFSNNGLVTRLFQNAVTRLSHDISLSSLENLPSNNETTNTKPSPLKRKRRIFMTELLHTGSHFRNASHWMTSWRRRRWSLRPHDDSSNIKNTALSLPTTETNRGFRLKPLKVLPIGFMDDCLMRVSHRPSVQLRSLSDRSNLSDLQSEFYKSPICLCKVTRMEGRGVEPVAWRRFYIYIGGGYIRFLLASDYHGFNQNASSSLLNNVDPFTLEGVSTSRCIILPLIGLQWSSRPYFASDVPTWDTSAPVSLINSSSFRRSPQSSEMIESEPTNDLLCYLFEHECNGGSEITVIFPETQTLNKTVELCQRHGGVCKENNPSLNSSTIPNSSLVTSHSTKQPSHHMTAALRRNRKSLPDSAIRRKLAADAIADTKRTQDRPLDSEGEQPPPISSQLSGGSADGSKCRFFTTSAAPFFKSIANAISSSRATDFNSLSDNNPTDALPMSAEEIARRVTAALSEPPDFGDLNRPGPVFGASLEKQVPSPDYPNVPLVLHATISALEQLGLHHVGLYRAPGRQKEINRFVCLWNLISLDPRVMLSLSTWSDVRVLTGVIKVFFRRLSEPICDSDSWKSLVCLIPEDSGELDESSLVYTLQAIRAKLNKIRSTSYLPLNVSPTEQGSSMVSWRWRYATLDFLFTHLRRIVALEATNQCSFKCIAICFGPSLFNADNDLQNKFNVLLEVMLQHWPWLTADESGASMDESSGNTDHSSSSAALRNTTISETEAYVRQFLENGPNFNDLSFSRVASLQDSLKVKDTLEDIFERAGYQISSHDSLENSGNREEEKEESLLDVIMRSLPQPVGELGGEQILSSNGQVLSSIPQRTDS